MGIEWLAGRRFGHLSIDEQWRFLLGRTLIHDSPVLVMDEPTSGLDVKACSQYLGLFCAQTQRGKKVFLRTYHLHEIPLEVGWVILLKEKSILANGPKDSLFTDER